ncbi:isoprenoid synthase domain-containing protein [Colletotrichum godetiae]|uniref:Terpene synthase n=1 Tax=Colletotrichum godetiae TaxID=1209918 RepID=A0AAJ0AG65_9PEZI|nr:isoprenoid synthase domain-containing protein [Colletotrichum godetiae]KAK1673302.1 isoprenoid synthase domain-containing protein [Colletotrichum godetiae]
MISPESSLFGNHRTGVENDSDDASNNMSKKSLVNPFHIDVEDDGESTMSPGSPVSPFATLTDSMSSSQSFTVSSQEGSTLDIKLHLGITSDESSVNYVRIPDFFSSIMSVKPAININYEHVKKEADSWIAKILHLSEAQARRNVQANFAFMNAMWVPYADAEAYRTMVDWNNWVFAFDDQFDEGHLKDDPIKAVEELHATFAVLEDTQAPVQLHDNSIRYVFQTVWDRLKKRSTKELQRRYKASIRYYFSGLLSQVGVETSKSAMTLTVDEYMGFRRGTIGCQPSYVLVEFCHGIIVPSEVIDDESLQECRRISADLVILVNDILSYRKDLEQGVQHNLIALLKSQGHSTQEAIDEIGDMIDECYRDWYLALSKMPICGEKIDQEVIRYLNGCRDVALGNLHWSYESGRYLGDEGALVRQTRTLRLPEA